MLPFALGVPVLVLPVAAATVQPSARSLGIVSASDFFLALCLTSVLWSNTVVDDSSLLDTVNGDDSSLLDTVNGWFFGAAFLMVWTTLFSVLAVARYSRRS